MFQIEFMHNNIMYGKLNKLVNKSINRCFQFKILVCINNYILINIISLT